MWRKLLLARKNTSNDPQFYEKLIYRDKVLYSRDISKIGITVNTKVSNLVDGLVPDFEYALVGEIVIPVSRKE